MILLPGTRMLIWPLSLSYQIRGHKTRNRINPRNDVCVHASSPGRPNKGDHDWIRSAKEKLFSGRARWIFLLFFVLWNPQEQIHLRRCPSCDDIEIVWPGCRERNRGKKRRFLNLFTPCECLYGSAEIERERSEFLCAVLVVALCSPLAPLVTATQI